MAWVAKNKQASIKSPSSLHEDCRDKALGVQQEALSWQQTFSYKESWKSFKEAECWDREGKWVTNRNPAQKQLTSAACDAGFSHAAQGGKDASFLNFHLWRQQAKRQCYVANRRVLQQFSPISLLVSFPWINHYWWTDLTQKELMVFQPDVCMRACVCMRTHIFADCGTPIFFGVSTELSWEHWQAKVLMSQQDRDPKEHVLNTQSRIAM